MKFILAAGIAFFGSVLVSVSQVQLDKPIQLTGSGADAKVSGIKSITGAQDAVSAEAVQASALSYANATGSVNAYEVTLNPAVPAYTPGLIVHFKANGANTGSCTLNVNQLGARSIRKNYNTQMASGDILSGQVVSVIYDGTNFQMLSQLAAAPGVTITAYSAAQPCKQTSYNSVSWTFAEVFPDAFNAGENLSRCYFIYGKENHTFEFQNGGSCPGTSFSTSGGPCGTNMSGNVSSTSTWNSVYMDTGGCISGIASAARPKATGMKLVCFR